MSAFTPINTEEATAAAATAATSAGQTEEPVPTTPIAATALRRPQTTDLSAFWHITQERWDQLLSEAAEKATKKNAMNTLRKYDAAGRIMETEEGFEVDEPCSWCARDGHTWPCRAYKDRKEQGCAYCRRHAKSGCYVGDPSLAPGLTTEQRVKALEQEMEELKMDNSALREQLHASDSASERRLTALERWVNNILDAGQERGFLPDRYFGPQS